LKHAKPTLKHEKKTDIQRDDKKRKAQKKAAYHHSKPSELQEPTDTTMLRDTSASESAFKHQSDVMEPLPISDTVSEQTGKTEVPGATAAGTEKTKKSRKLAKAEKQVGRTDAKLNQAKENLPTKKKPRTRLVFDETKGKAKREFYFEKQVKPQVEHIKGSLSQRPVKMAVNSAIAFGHKKIYQVEHENVGVKAGHRVEMVVEGGVRTALRHRKTAPHRKVAKLERKSMKKRINLSHRQALERNPKLKSNLLSRMWQKRNIKKQYAKATRDTKRAAAKKTGSLTTRIARTIVRITLKRPKVILLLLVIGLLVSAVMSLFTLGAGLGGSGLGAVLNVSYLAEDEDIDAAALVYTEWETDLRLEILNAEAGHPGFAEYRYEIGHIGHSPHVLMAFLTARFQNFTFAQIVGELRAIFDTQYNLSFTPSIEIRTRTNDDGEVVQYEWHILTVRLESIPLINVILPLMDESQLQHFGVLMQTQGARQRVGSPFPFNWLPHVSSLYGWRVHPIRGERALHRGVDIALPIGTEILSTQYGIVTFAGYDADGFGNFLVIDDGKGVVTKYAHCHTLLVRNGDTVAMGDVIATVGSTGASTGPHLHFEVLIDGVHRNPLFFALTNPHLFSADGGAGSAMTADQFSILYAEARRHLGTPYQYGANGPHAFDCSSFVAWVFRESGIYPLPRTTAQGIYNRTNPVPFGMHQPGDIIFFHSTYNTTDWITHLGIYVGGGRMIHAGSPVQYANISTPFWQRHFAGFGRLPI